MNPVASISLFLLALIASPYSALAQNRTPSNQTLTEQAIIINVQTVNATCRSNSGSINATATGGTAPYKYKINGEGPFDNGYYPAIPPGNHLIEVTDANGLTAFTTSLVANTNDPPAVAVTSFTSPTSCDAADGSFVIAPSGGVPPFEYTLDMVRFTSTPSFSNLAAGFYTVMVRDAKGCVGTARVTLTNPLNCGVPVGVTFTPSVCGADGTVTIKYLGNDAPYESNLNGGAYSSTTQYSNIAAGEYTLNVRSAAGERTRFMFHVVKACVPEPNVEVTDNTCNAADGRVTITADNGTAPYRYSLDGINFQTSNQFSGLAAGRYNIGVMDAAGVLAKTEAHVNGGCYNVTETHTNVSCGNRNGRIELTASGGSAPYRYSINDGAFQSSNIFENLAAGTYRITVVDNDGQSKSVTVIIENTLGPTGVGAAAPAGCLGDIVTLTATVNGGTLPLQYSLNDIDYQASPQFDVETGQTYRVYVKDANDCKVSTTYQPPVGCFTIAITATNADCGLNNGTLNVTITDGHPPFEYSIDGTNFQPADVFANLAPRVYTVTVRDAENNIQRRNAEVISSCPQLRVTIQNASCGNSNGSITVSGASGRPPYQYSFNGGAYSNQTSFTNLDDGTYTLYLRDAVGYIVERQVVVTNSTDPLISVSSTDAICATGGTISITGSGGTGALWYSIDGTNYSASPEFNMLQPGIYQAYVSDNLGCKNSVPVEVRLVNDITFDVTGDFDICFGETTTIEVAQPKLTFNYLWSAGDGSVSAVGSLLNVTPDSTTAYTVNVTEGLCATSRSVVVTVHPLPVADAGEDVTVCYGFNTRLNGSGGQTYHWSPAIYLSDPVSRNPEVVHPDASQEYVLMVKDANGCTSAQSSSVWVTVVPPVEVYAGRDTIVSSDVPLQLNAVDVKNSGFIRYEWTPSVGLSNSQIPNPVAILKSSTVFSVKAVTKEGCESGDEIKIVVYKGPDIYVPNAFTPNRDGVNDELKFFPVGIQTFKHITVFNRWGNRVYHSTNSSGRWNGYIGSKPAETGTYVWIVEGIDFNGKIITKRGVVQLIR